MRKFKNALNHFKTFVSPHQESIAIYYKHEAEINLIVRKLPSVKWSQTNRCWYLPLTKASYNQLKKELQEVSKIDDTLLKKYLEKRKQVTEAAALPKKSSVKPALLSTAWKLSPQNLTALEKFTEQLKLKAYSASTIRTYRNEFLQLLQILKKKNVDDLTPDDLRRYMVYAMEKQGIKENTAHSRINALPSWI